MDGDRAGSHGSSSQIREESWLWCLLACPMCGAELDVSEKGALCKGCSEAYPRTNEGRLDLRLRGAKRVQVDLEVGIQSWSKEQTPFVRLSKAAVPRSPWKGLRAPKHMSPEMLAHLPRGAPESLALDLGCGEGTSRETFQELGFRWVGVDISPSSEATVLADAHALPFAAESFDFVLSMAVLEHLTHPVVAMKEVYRTLKANGSFMGTVAFLEPFHSNSHYHHTHLGLLACLRSAGLRIEWVSPQPDWQALAALSGCLFPRAPRWLSMVFMGVPSVLHRGWWEIGKVLSRNGKRLEEKRLFALAGAFAFKALKE